VLAAITLPIALVVAWLSWKFIEAPFMRLKRRSRRVRPPAPRSTLPSGASTAPRT
jgi:peptidoglycan/LPS O-acetylase OafA/YrhL